MGKPSATFEEYNLGAAGSIYIAKYTGYFCFSTSGSTMLQLKNNTRNSFMSAAHSHQTEAQSIYVPCVKGDEIQVYYSGLTSGKWLRNYADVGQI